MAQLTRTDIGFQGGQVLSVRTGDDAYERLIKALADDQSPRWHTLEADDERIEIDSSQVVYVRRETGSQKIGF